MKTNYRKILTGCFLVIIGLLISNVTAGQNRKTSLLAGASIPDFFHAGVAFTLNDNVCFNLKLGSVFHETYGFWGVYTIGSDLSFYVGKEFGKYGFKRWAINSGLTFMRDESASKIWHYLFFDNSLSYDFYISKHLIFQPEAGIAFRLFEDETQKPDYEPGWFGTIDIDVPVVPVFGARFKIIL